MRYLIAIVLSFVLVVNAYGFQIQKGRLTNGLRYVIARTTDVPIVSMTVMVRAGSVFDEKGKYGEAKVLATTLENCDTAHLKSKKLRFLFDKYGIISSVSVSKGYITISAVCLKENMDKMFYLVGEILKSRFDKKNFSIVKRQVIDRLKMLKNDKDYLAIHAAFEGLIAQSEYSHTSIGTLDGLKSITRGDVKGFFKKYFSSGNMVVALAGGLSDTDQLKIKLEKTFSSVKNTSGLKRFKDVSFRSGLNITNIVKPATKQSYIYFAFPSFDYPSKKYYASLILANILGGKLNSFLTKDIRTKHGYAYSIFAFNYRLPKRSVFVIGLQTQNRFTLDAIKRVFEDIGNFDGYITKKNITAAKEYLVGSMLIGLQTPQSISSRLAFGEMNGLGDEPWVFDKRMIRSITIADVRDAAKSIFGGSLSIGCCLV